MPILSNAAIWRALKPAARFARSFRAGLAYPIVLVLVSQSVASAHQLDYSDQPLNCDRSLQSIVDAAPAGATVNLPACVFRETVTLHRPITLVGQPGTEIRGSDPWSDWNQAGGVWVSQLAEPVLPIVSNDPNACEPGSSTCLDAEEVFYDGIPLTLAPAGALPGPGQFSDDRGRITIADDPDAHLVEVAVRARWIVTSSDGVSIKGITMRHAANGALEGAISNDGFSNWTLEDSVLSDAHATDISVDGGHNSRVLRNDISEAGLAGVSTSGQSTSGLVQSNHLHDNRVENIGFNRSWGAGGLKLTDVQDFVVDGNEVDHNDGTGLWCDVGCANVTFSNNRVHHNQWQGINFEISDGASIHDNDLWENGWGFQAWGWGAGITVSSSANAEVYNNIAAWNYAGISVIWQNRPDSPGPDPVGNFVHDNTIVKRTVTGDFGQTFWSNLSLAWLSDGTAPFYTPAFNNQGMNNAVWYDQPEEQTVRFSWTTQYFSLRQFADAPGGTGAYYLSSAAMQQILSDHNLPLTPEET